jgi:hypothetical protein
MVRPKTALALRSTQEAASGKGTEKGGIDRETKSNGGV